MADFKFLHVGISFDGPAKIAELEPIFDKANDWLRYAANCWILRTSNPPQVWSERIRKVLGEKDTFLICEIDLSNRQGWLYPKTWEWINRKR